MRSYGSFSGLSIEEKSGGLFQPDTILAAQYSQAVRARAYLEPEKRLMLAILEDAVSSFQKHLYARDRKRRMLFDEAETWILDQGRDSFFAFENVCEILGFDPRYIRAGLRQWKEKRIANGIKAKIPRLDLQGKPGRLREHTRAQ